MQIQIDLPISSLLMGADESNYQIAKSFLKQMELAVHHAQKALDQMKQMNEDTGKEDKEYTVNLRVTAVEYYNDENQEGNPATAFIEIYSS